MSKGCQDMYHNTTFLEFLVTVLHLVRRSVLCNEAFGCRVSCLLVAVLR